MAERAIALGNDDPFDYALALEMGITHRDVHALPHDEYVRWRAYMNWRAIQRRHADDVTNARMRRG